jgi:aminoglycoside phosphotransferase (APT) family kinase protein
MHAPISQFCPVRCGGDKDWQPNLGDDARWDGVESWFHGDVAAGNLLLSDGQLAAVIDFGTCGIGDPACDLAIAWTLLTAEGRQALRGRLSPGKAEWARGRGWALWKTLATCAYTLGDGAGNAASARRVLGEIFSEYAVDLRSGAQPATG